MEQESPSWCNLTLGQLSLLVDANEFQTFKNLRSARHLDAGMLSKNWSVLENALKVGQLADQPHRTLELNAQGKLLASAIVPLIELLERLQNGELSNSWPTTFRMGGGGSLVSWLIASRAEQLKKLLSERLNNPGQLAELNEVYSPSQIGKVKLVAEPYTNTEIVQLVCCGALDCGLVRDGVITDKRLPIISYDIGVIYYHMYVPDDWLPEGCVTAENLMHGLPENIERDLLRKYPIATVGRGQFRQELDRRLSAKTVNIQPNIEFSYRAFPMLMPHIMASSHIAIMPDIAQLVRKDEAGKSPYLPSIMGYHKFPLRLMANHHRNIKMIVHKSIAESMPWLDLKKLRSILEFQ